MENTSVTNFSVPAGLIVRNFYENAGVLELKGGLTSFGQVFKPGELPRGHGLEARVQNQTSQVQVDVKTTYADGSAKMAVLTMARPDLAAGATADIELYAAPAAAPGKLDFAGGLAQHQFQVALTSGGATTQIDVLKAMNAALADGSASFWQEGPLASQARVEVEVPGSQRLVFDVTVFKNGGMEVDAQFNNDGAMEAVGGRVDYKVAVTMDGRQVLDQAVSQAQYQNWHESFSTDERNGGQGLGAPTKGWLNIGHDVAHLQAVGAVAGYNLQIGISETLLDRWGDIAATPGWDAPLANREVTQYMPGPGGRGDIGITTAYNTGWLMSQDARAAAMALGQAEAASSIPWHFRDTANKTWLNTDAYPTLWTDGRGGTGRPGDPTSGGLTQQTDPNTGWYLDTAHQPSLSFVPYLLTGERWMFDNVQSQAAWNIMTQGPSQRDDAEDLVVQGNQVRGSAWALRQIDDAAWASIEGTPEKAAFLEASAANWSWIVSQIPAWTEMQGEAHGWLPGAYGYANVLPPWQQDYFASTAIAAAARGNADAITYLKWASNFLVGRFTHAADGMPEHDGAAFLIPFSDPATGKYYQTWGEIGAAMAASGKSNGNGWSQSQGDYGQLALATLAGIANVLGSAEAAQAYRALMDNPPPFTSAADFQRDPSYALAPPGGTQVVVVPPSDPVSPPSGGGSPTPQPPPPSPPPADGTMVSISAKLSGDSWQGDPLAVVMVDGVEVFRGAISASQASNGQEVALGKFAAAAAHNVTVKFLNDAWGGTAATDRNLYVEDILVNGVSTGKEAALNRSGSVSFDLPAQAADGQPPVVTPPALADTYTLRLGVSGDAWNGTPHFQILLDGQALGGIRTTSASHSAGQTEYLDFQAKMSGSPPVLTVRFLDDAWGGTAATDRNLYVDEILVNGVSTGQEAALKRAGAATFELPVQAAPPASGSSGAESFTMRLGVSGDAYQGTPHFQLFLDGKELGGIRTTTASRAEGGKEYFDLTGDITGGPQVLTVRFLDDAWGGTPATDRNLYVESLSLNGTSLNKSAIMERNGDVALSFTPTKAIVVPVSTPSDPTIGTGPDVLRIGLSGDAWNGTPHFSVLVDGRQIGGVQTTTARNSEDEESFLNVLGDFSPGLHKLAIRFLDDAWGGKPDLDRNLYVESIEYNGVDLNHEAMLSKNGDAVFQF